MFSAKVKFSGLDFDTTENKVIEYPADSFPEALRMADLILEYNGSTSRPLSIDILENDRIIASLRTFR